MHPQTDSRDSCLTASSVAIHAFSCLSETQVVKIEINIDFLQQFVSAASAAAGLGHLSHRVCAVSPKNLAIVFGHCQPTKPHQDVWVHGSIPPLPAINNPLSSPLSSQYPPPLRNAHFFVFKQTVVASTQSPKNHIARPRSYILYLG